MRPEENNPSILSRLVAGFQEYTRIPRFSDPDKQQVAEVLHILSTWILGLIIATFLISPIIFTRNIVGLTVTAGFILPIILIQIISRRGHVQLAAHIFLYSVWILDTAIIILSDGFYSPYLTAYVTISVMGGLILGGVAIFHFAGISILATAIIYFLGTQGIIPEPIIQFNTVALFIINTVGVLIPSLTLYLVIQKYEQTVLKLTENEESLSRSNQELNWEIRARKEAEVLQIQSEKRFKSALMESPIPILLHADDGEIILINHAWVEKSGYPAQRLVSLNDWLNNCFREEASLLEQEINQIYQSNRRKFEGYFTLYTEPGANLRWYLRLTQLPDLPDGRRLILIMASDMTNLLDVESALRESEENLSRFSLLTNDGIWDWDLKTDEVYFDPLYYTMAGYGVDEFPHQLEEFRKRVHPDDVEKVFTTAESHLAGKIDQFIVEFRFLRKDGTWLWIMGRGKVTEQDENGNPVRFVGTHTDISAQKAVEEQLQLHQLQLEDVVEDRTQRLNERISEVERLNMALTNILDDYQIANEKLSRMSSSLAETYQELESFTYSVSTDLRRPLMEIQESVQELTRNHTKDLSKKAQKELDQLQQNATLMDQLINDLIQLSKMSKVKLSLEEVDPTAIVNQVIQTFSDEIAQREIEIVTKELPACQADRELISIVFQNLISNAIKFTQKKKKPVITIGYQPDESSDRITYFIQDNGLGFNMNDKEKVFETFQRLHTQKEYEGTGAGLALVKKIVNRHGGEIWAEGKENKGAVFYFDLARS